MKKILHFFSPVIAFIFLTACSSSPYKYNVDPIPIEKGKTKYSLTGVSVTLSKFKVKLTKEDKKNVYPSEKEMGKIFSKKITNLLEKNNILAKRKDGKSYKLSVKIDYERTFAVNSNQVIEPEFSYSWEIKDGKKTIVQYSSKRMQVSSGPLGLGNISGFGKGFSSKTNPEDEIKYIEKISKHIVENNILDVGK